MSEELLKSSAGTEFKEIERVKFDNPSATLEESCNKLSKFGGYDFLESLIDGVQNLNPEKKAKKKIFLTENDKRASREKLKNTLNLWLSMIQENNSISEMIEKSEAKAQSSERLLKKNLGKALEATKDLERSYRSVNLFFKNTEGDKLKNISILNASMDQLKDLDNPRFIEHVGEELWQNYDRLDLRDNYSLLCIPGYLGSKKVVEKWAKLAHKSKVMLVTDFQHLDDPDGVIEEFSEADLASGDKYLSNVMMACNWLVGRAKASEVGEDEDLYVPPSSALAGTLYKTLMSQVSAGKKHGGMNEIDGVTFDLKKSEIANIEKMGLIPMVNEYGKVMAFSAKTLFNGDNLGLQTYSVVRVFDYITKVLMDFLNRRAIENFNSRTERELKTQITKFLDSITGPDNLIESFVIKRFVQDPNQKDRIYLDIHMTPYFPGKSFMIKMDGQKGDDPNATWDTAYDKA